MGNVPTIGAGKFAEMGERHQEHFLYGPAQRHRKIGRPCISDHRAQPSFESSNVASAVRRFNTYEGD
ncbi:hypothetical protein DB347_25105 [Opitutaceae bacterium EW11]|nr:hypothetical protein DB347_25105 [Opitutaceae bacterium EW11]